MGDISCEKGGKEPLTSNFPLIPQDVYSQYSMLTQVLYIFSMCIYTLFQLLPTVSHLFLLSFFMCV